MLHHRTDRRHRLSANREFENYKASVLPPEGFWSNETFRTRNGAALIKDLLNVTRFAKAKGKRKMMSDLKVQMLRPVEEVLRRIQRVAGHMKTIGGMERLWESVINEVFRETGWGDDLVASVAPSYQSTGDTVFNRNGVLLGDPPSDSRRRTNSMRMQRMAERVRGINGTTRNNLARDVVTAQRRGMSLPETVKWLRSRFPQIATNRIPTIARTEMGRAADQAAVHSMQQSRTVTHCDVVGCMAVEDNIPQYRGVPTCNITNVPVEDAGLLDFHINHTGIIVPSKFATVRPPSVQDVLG